MIVPEGESDVSAGPAQRDDPVIDSAQGVVPGGLSRAAGARREDLREVGERQFVVRKRDAVDTVLDAAGIVDGADRVEIESRSDLATGRTSSVPVDPDVASVRIAGDSQIVRPGVSVFPATRIAA